MLPGIGVWIWYPDRANSEDGNLTDHLQMLWDSGVRRLYIKSSDGVNVWKDSLSLVDQIKSDGWDFKIWGWHYSYKPSAAEVRTIKATARYPFDGLVLDIEQEYKNLTHSTADSRTGDFIKKVRASWDNWPIWVSSFAFPQYHSSMPWKGLEEADGFFPQLFPGYGGSLWSMPIRVMVHQVIEQHRAMDITKAVVPLYETYQQDQSPITTERLRECLEASLESRGSLAPLDQTINFYRWGKMGGAHWDVIREFEFPPTPDVIDDAAAEFYCEVEVK